MNRKDMVLLAVLCIMMVLPAVGVLGILVNFDKLKEPGNYTEYSYIDVQACGDGAVLKYVDYSTGEGRIILERLEKDGDPTGVEYEMGMEGRDLFAGRTGSMDSTLYMTYLATIDEMPRPRYSDETDVELYIVSLDVDTLTPKGPFESPSLIARFPVMDIYHSYFVTPDSFMAEYFSSRGIEVLNDEVDVFGIFNMRFNANYPTLIHGSWSADADKIAVFVNDQGNISLALIDPGLNDIRLLPSNATGPANLTTGMDILAFDKDLNIEEDRECDYKITLSSSNGSFIWKWEAEFPVNVEYKTAMRSGNDIYFLTKEPGYFHMTIGEQWLSYREVTLDLSAPELEDAEIGPGSEVSMGWSGYDVDEEEGAIAILSIPGPGEEGTIARTTAGGGWVRFCYTSAGELLGIYDTGGSGYKVTTFTVNNGWVNEGKVLVSSRAVDPFVVIIAMLIVIVVGMFPIVLMARSSRSKAFRKMSPAQLQLFDEKVLGKALGKKVEGLDKDGIIKELLKEPEYEEHTPEEEKRIIGYFYTQYAYYPLIAIGFAQMMMGLLLRSIMFPAFALGISSFVTALFIMATLAVMIFFLRGEWTVSGTRKAGLILMGAGILAGELFMGTFIYMLLFPSTHLTSDIIVHLRILPSVCVMGLIGPMIALYDRKKDWKVLLAASIVLVPFLLAVGASVQMMTQYAELVPYMDSTSMFFLEGFVFLFVCMMFIFGPSVAISENASIGEVKPLNRWSMEDLLRIRRAPLLLSILGTLGLTALLIPLFGFVGFTLEPMVLLLSFGAGGVVIFLSGLLFVIGITQVKNLHKDKKGLGGVLLMIYLTPLITVIAGIILGLTLSFVGILLAGLLAVGQIVFADHYVRKTFSSLSYEVEVQVKMEEETIKRFQAAPTIKMYLPTEDFIKKLRSNTRGIFIVDVVMSAGGLFIAMFGDWTRIAGIIRGVVPNWVALMIFLCVLAPLLIVSYLLNMKTGKERKPLRLVSMQAYTTVSVFAAFTVPGFAFLITEPLYILPAIAAFLIPTLLILRSYEDRAKRTFLSLTKEERMLLPAEMLIFKSKSMMGPDVSKLQLPPDQLAAELRNKPPRAAPPPPSSAKEEKRPVPPQRDDNGQIIRGKLLLTEQDPIFARRRKNARMGAFVILGLALLMLLMVIAGPFYSFVCGLIFGAFLIIPTALLVFLGFLILVGKGAKSRVEFHEYGAIDHAVLGGKEIFIPYGNMVKESEGEYAGVGKVVKIKSQTNESFFLPLPNAPHSEHTAEILEKVGKPEFAGIIENSTRTRMNETIMPLIIVPLIVLGSIATALLTIFQADFSWKLGLISGSGAWVIITLMLLSSGGKKGQMPQSPPSVKVRTVPVFKTFRFKIMAAMMAIGLLLTVLSVALSLVVPGGIMVEEIMSEGTPSTSLGIEDLIGNDTFEVRDHLVVSSGERIDLKDMSITFNGRSSSPLMFYVEKGGELFAENVTMASISGSFGLSMELHGRSIFQNCTFNGLWAEEGITNGQGGLEVYSDGTEFHGCNFINATGNLLMIVDCKVLVENCTFIGAKDDAIECQNADLTLLRSSISDSAWAMVIFDGSRVDANALMVKNCDYGIVLSWSDATISDSTFEDIDEEAIDYSFGSDLSTSGNSYSNVKIEIERSRGSDVMMFGMCSVLPIIVGILGIGLIIVRERKKAQNEPVRTAPVPKR